MRRGSLASLALPIAAIAGWAHLREPLHAWGLGLLLVPAVILAVMMPAIALSVRALPLLLIPSGLIIWWREGRVNRPHIPNALRYAVYAADHWCCAWCGSPDKLQLDHVKPFSRGGLTVTWNLVTLCGKCNRTKSNCWIARNGYVFYRSFKDSDNRRLALQILLFERRHRWRPGRWIRAGWTLAA